MTPIIFDTHHCTPVIHASVQMVLSCLVSPFKRERNPYRKGTFEGIVPPLGKRPQRGCSSPNSIH